jgi:hypothetical protein
MPNLSRRHLVTTAAALPALALQPLTSPAEADEFDKAAIIARAEDIVETLRGGFVREGWSLDETKATAFLDSVRQLDTDAEHAALGTIRDWTREHGQSLDWLIEGDPTVMICRAAAHPALAYRIGPNHPDAELLRLGVELEALIVDWHAQQAVDRKEWADIDAALEAAGLPDIERGSLPDDDYRAYRLKRADATDAILRDRRGPDYGVSIAWTNIHDRQDPLIDAIMAIKPRTLAGLAVVARAFTLHHAEQWEHDYDEGLHHRAFMEAACAIAGVVPVPAEAVRS